MPWTFDSHEQLARAGYRFRSEVVCGRCGERVLIYAAPKGYVVALERYTFVLHRERCPARPRRAPPQPDLFGGHT